MEKIARYVLVSGQVQGVAFRHHTKVLARELGLAGWVRNLADGRVEVWAEGEARDVDALVEWLRRGPPAACVENLDLTDEVPADHPHFKVRFD